MSDPKLEAQYTDERVRQLLSYFFNGEQPYQESEQPEPGMPKSTSNPARQGDSMAEMIDIKRAYNYCAGRRLFWSEAFIVDVMGHGKTLQEVADYWSEDREVVKKAVDHDVQVLVDYLNGSGLND